MNSTSHLSDDALVNLMRKGDEEAFVALYRRRQPDIYRFIFGMSSSRMITEEVTQEVFIILIRQT